MKINEIINKTTQIFEECFIPSARNEVEILVAFILKIDIQELRKNIIFEKDCDLNLDELKEYVRRRTKGEPLQLLIGSTYFFNVELQTEKGVFIPRPETEMITSDILCKHGIGDKKTGLRYLDICTGTGAILLSLLRSDFLGTGIGIDINPKAIELFKKNSRLNQLENRATVINCDATNRSELLSQLSTDVHSTEQLPNFDIITCNPPYIPKGTKISTEAQFDPVEAIFGGGDDGFEIPRKIIQNIPYLIKDGGWFYLEHFDNQHEQAKQFLQSAGAKKIESAMDLNSVPRFTIAQF